MGVNNKGEIDMNEFYLYNSDDISRKINVNGTIIGDNERILIAGPCTFGSYEELFEIAKELKRLGVKFLRGGAYKTRTDPYSFQGLQDEGIEILLRIKRELELNIVVELTNTCQVKKYSPFIDIIQIGSRNMYNYDLLREVGKSSSAVLLKRGLSASYKEWLLAAEYILKEGNKRIVLCERGIRNSVSNETRNVLDIQAVPYMKKHTKLPIIIDPSHASGQAYMVEDMSKAALVAGADGLIIEVHVDPSKSLCDSQQTINMEQFENIFKFNKELNKNIL